MIFLGNYSEYNTEIAYTGAQIGRIRRGGGYINSQGEPNCAYYRKIVIGRNVKSPAISFRVQLYVK